MSGRVTSSGKMPAVCSNRLRRSCVSVVPNRCAMPGRYQTGSIAILTTERLPLAWMALPSAFSRPAASASRISIRSSRARVIAMRRADVEPLGDLLLELLGNQMPPRIERHDPLRLAPLRERADHRGGMRVGEIGPPDRVKHAGGNGERAIERVRAAVTADHVAQARLRHRSDHRPALASRGGAPMNRKARLRLGVGMRGKPDMILPVR